MPPEDRLLAVQLMNVQGPMARRVADVRAALRVLMGAHPRDPWSLDAPRAAEAGRADPRGRARRAAGRRHAPEVVATVRRAAQALADAGYAVEEACRRATRTR